MKPAPTAALRVHHCQGREHPPVRESCGVSESETPSRGGRDAVYLFDIFYIFYTCHLLYMCVLFFSLLVLSVVLLKVNIFSFSLGETPKADSV